MAEHFTARRAPENIIRSMMISLCSDMGVIITDIDGKIATMNELGEKIIGLEFYETVGRNVKLLNPALDISNILITGSPERNKAAIRNNIYLINKMPLVEEGQVVGAIILLNDISSLTDEMELVQQISQELNTILDSIYDAIIISDGEGYVWRANKAYHAIAGVTEDDYVGKHVSQLVKERFVSKSVVEKIIETGKAESLIQRLKSGKELLNTGIPIFNQQGKIVRVVTILRDLTELNRIKERLFEISEENRMYQEELEKAKNIFDNQYVIYSQKMRDVFEIASRVSYVDSTVLITGDSGVGKEIVAQYIHQNSYRKNAPYVKLNCGAMTESLIEAELFGYEEGAFTGATRGGKKGLLEVAQNGTILFDEIAELSLNMQVKLLRVLQEREFCRVGGTQPISIDSRFIFATNKDLGKMVEEGTFREDLFYRCNVVVVNIPPLRERKEDIQPLVMLFLKKFNEKYHQQKRITREALTIFRKHEWPGNIRELQNIIERLVVTYPKDIIDNECMHKFGFIGSESNSNLESKEMGLKEALEKVEREMIKQAYEKGGCTRSASTILGISQSTVVKKMKKYGLEAN